MTGMSRNRVAATKKSYVMSRTDQFLRKIRDDPFRPAVMFGRDTFNQRRNLCNSHLPSLCFPFPRYMSFLKHNAAKCAFAPKKPDSYHRDSRNIAYRRIIIYVNHSHHVAVLVFCRLLLEFEMPNEAGRDKTPTRFR